MTFELPPLPYDLNALVPYISEETLAFHYGKHHQAYVNKLNTLVKGSEFADANLEDIITNASGGIFNNAAQVWNHTFYWRGMQAHGEQKPSTTLVKEIEKHFGSVDKFKELFTQAAINQFGSGWAWLIKTPQGSLEITSTSNADNPLTTGKTPLLTCDVWEHAYYIDTRNDRPKYVNNFWQLINWSFVEENLAK